MFQCDINIATFSFQKCKSLGGTQHILLLKFGETYSFRQSKLIIHLHFSRTIHLRQKYP